MTSSILKGAKRGLLAGVVFATIGIALNQLLDNAPAQRLGMGVPAIVALYLAGGTSGGAIAGLFAPHVRNAYGAALTAASALFPLIAIARVTQFGSGAPSLGEVFGLGVAALFLGSLWGPMIWRASKQKDG